MRESHASGKLGSLAIAEQETKQKNRAVWGSNLRFVCNPQDCNLQWPRGYNHEVVIWDAQHGVALFHSRLLRNSCVHDYCMQYVASSPGPTQILSRSRGEKSGEGLVAKLRHDQKWWTRLLRNVDSVIT